MMNTTTGISVTITTPDFRRGQAAARNVAALACEPNWALVERGTPEFTAGFRYEWNEHIAPTRGV